MSHSKKKVDAIYDLRAAAEKKGRAEREVDVDPTPEKRDELLDAKLDLEEKTVEAIEVCNDCGHQHAPGQPHSNVVRFKD